MAVKTVACDRALGAVAYRFSGLAQPFPSHFHEHYVIGLVERGRRLLHCRGLACPVSPGDLLIFHPGEPHSCEPCGGGLLDYRALNLPAALLQDAAGLHSAPRFPANVLHDPGLADSFRALHQQFLCGADGLGREESLFLFLSRLLCQYGQPEAAPPPCPSEGVGLACAYLESHFAGHVTLSQLCRCAGLSKSTLLRAFTRAKGMTPYRYLEAVRVNHAKKLLEAGVPPSEAALRSGFSDQSHFTGYFSRFLGLTPGAYRDMFVSSREIPTAPQGESGPPSGRAP